MLLLRGGECRLELAAVGAPGRPELDHRRLSGEGRGKLSRLAVERLDRGIGGFRTDVDAELCGEHARCGHEKDRDGDGPH